MPSKYKQIQRLTIALSSLIIIIFIILYPKQSLSASLKGLNTWLNIVFPALLPFFIVSEIMMDFGVVDLLSALLNPIMKPVFNCPGQGSFVWVMSITSGYPMGAKLISSLYEKGSITKVEGQRMLAFCNTSGPLFMIGAVGIGMLDSQEAGKIIATSHYLAALLLGILFRFYGREKPRDRSRTTNPNIDSAFRQLFNRKAKTNKSLGTILGDSVRHSMEAQLIIGGFIILFSVIINLIIKSGPPNGINLTTDVGTFIFPHGSQLLKILGAGILEITTSCQLLGEAILPLKYKIIAASLIIGWGGFSIHSQAISLLSNTDFSIGLYLMSKLIHGILSALIAYIWLFFFEVDSVPAFSDVTSTINTTMATTFVSSLQLLVSAVFIFIALYLFVILIDTIKN